MNNDTFYRLLENEYCEGTHLKIFKSVLAHEGTDFDSFISKLKEEFFGKTYTFGNTEDADKLRKIVYMRNYNGITKSDIARELGLNRKTIIKACNRYEESAEILKDVKLGAKLDSFDTDCIKTFFLKENYYARKTLTCPYCRKLTDRVISDIDGEAFNCRTCHNEFYLRNDDYIYKLKWEELQ